ncbi:MAG TPA: branched-chain amino acid ABC transporter permease [Pseudolabrys sp.]|jgi:branched-chain amino acid transport system permease protein|nr:branched-chain amino acid ABC transporter permease [Pseudolabrys sp.]
MLSNLSVLINAPVFNISLIVDGVLIGAIFALAAYGLALVWGVTSVKNLAQGDFVIMGGYCAWYATYLGVPPLLGLPIAMVVMALFGWVTFHLVVKHVIHRDLFTSLLATFGMAMVIEAGLNLGFGADVQSVNPGFGSYYLFGGLVSISKMKLIAFVLAGLLAVGIVIFMKSSRMGRAIRATAQDPRAARVLGIDTEKVYAFTFTLNAAICGAAGALVVMIWVIHPFIGVSYSIRSFVIVTAAGLGNLPGVIAVGLAMGILEQFGGFIMGAQYEQAIVVLLLLLVLVVRQIQQARVRQVVQ